MKRSSSFGKVAHAPVEAGRNGARQSVGQSIHALALSRSAPSALNFSVRWPVGSAWKRTFAGTLGSLFAEREASTIQTGCCTPWKMRVFTSG